MRQRLEKENGLKIIKVVPTDITNTRRVVDTLLFKLGDKLESYGIEGKISPWVDHSTSLTSGRKLTATLKLDPGIEGGTRIELDMTGTLPMMFGAVIRGEVDQLIQGLFTGGADV